MSKLRSVIRHEYTTIVKQPSFWIAMIAIPALIGTIFALTFLGNSSSEERIRETAETLKNVSIVDNSGLINKDVAKAGGFEVLSSANEDALREEVRLGEKEALIVYPKNLAIERKYSLYLSSNDLTVMGGAQGLATNLLKTSLFLPLGSADVIALAQEGPSADIVMYKDQQLSAGFNEYIAPGLFVVLFYIIFAFSISYMLTSVSEEKENRSMEMVLTYVKPRTLIIGKLLAVTLVTLTQIAFFALLAGIAFLVAQGLGSTLSLPFGLDVSKIVIDPVVIFFSASFLVVGFLMYAGFMTATAAAAPSSKEANNFSAVFFLGAFVPFYFIMMLVTDPTNSVVKFLSFFPLTSPIAGLVRNTVGNISLVEASLMLATMAVFMVLSIWLAVRAFKLGALEFAQTIQLSKLFKK